jgi:hypothetical protein
MVFHVEHIGSKNKIKIPALANYRLERDTQECSVRAMVFHVEHWL